MSETIFLKLTRIVKLLLLLLFTLLIIDVTWQVLSRYVLKTPSTFTEELSRYLLIWLTLLATAYSRSYRGQMAIDYFYQKFSEKNQRFLSIGIECCILLFTLGVFIIGGSYLVYITFYMEQKSSTLQLPMGVVYSIIPISGLLILWYTVYHLNQLFTSK